MADNSPQEQQKQRYRQDGDGRQDADAGDGAQQGDQIAKGSLTVGRLLISGAAGTA
jgi:hypothetical protein